MNIDPIPFEWAPAFLTWALICGVIFSISILIGLLFNLLTYGARGFNTFGAAISDGFVEILFMSPRRLWALAVLTFKESVRRKTLSVMVVFGICFLFAGWFLSNPTQNPLLRVQIYISFVLTAISWLILPSVFLLACWGLPDDIKARSLHTIVTKPARRSEILVGRMLGVTLIGTLIVGIMSIIGYLWLIRALPELKDFQCRVPVFGKITFKDREGKDVAKGINVGDINEFRSFIEGNTAARAIYKFTGVTPRLLNTDGKLVLESKFQGFRTHKGDMKQSLLFQYNFVNPKRNLRVKYRTLQIDEFRETTVPVETNLVDEQNRPVNLMTDVIENGELTVEVACMSTGQYLGMARPDLFIRDRDAPLFASFFKAVFCIWLMMVLIIVFAVSVSSIVKGPVTAFLLFVILILGSFGRGFMQDLNDDQKWKGGGMFESAYRIVTHMNPTVELKPSVWTRVVQVLDYPMLKFAGQSRAIIPDFKSYQTTEFVAKGFDVPWSAALLPAIMHTLSFLIPCVVLGCFSLNSRELESK